MEQVSSTIIGIVGLLAAVAIVSVLVSKKAQTPQVIQSAGSALGNDLGVAVSPVTGNQYQIDLSYPGEHGGGAAFQYPGL
jgi:PRD1 phage membrane DNA delivery